MFYAQSPSNQSPPSPGHPQKEKISTDGIACSGFRWGHSSESDKAALLVPISLNHKTYWYQLDTGADFLIPYGAAMPPGWSHGANLLGNGHNEVRIPNVRFAGNSIGTVRGFLNKDEPVSSDFHNSHGTIGLEILMGRTLVLDYPRQRVCLLNEGDLPAALAKAADWAEAELNHGKLYVEMKLNGKKLDGILFDTGSSPTELDMDLAPWKEFTGIQDTEKAPMHTKVCCAWGGRELEFVGAPANGELEIGNHSFHVQKLTTEPARPEDYHTNLWGQGSIGNALFWNGIVILDLGAHPSFGYIETKK